ncbi:unnamed protein product, partial [Meganyctiphanes norvegica]
GILCLMLLLTEIHISESICSTKLVKYWKKQYQNNYFGKLKPWSRCKSENGRCIRKQDTCDSRDWVRYQTTCEDRCDCCFKTVRNRDAVDWVLVMKRLKWDDAREDCRREKNGDLVVPENIGDLIKFMQDKHLGKADVWVGINDKFNGRFEGVYGNDIRDGWHTGQPRRITRDGQNCVVVEDVSSTRDKVGMKVEPCYATNYYICDTNRNNRNRHDVYLVEDEKPNRREDEDED